MSYKSKFSPSIGDLIVATIMSHKNSAQFHKILREREFARYKEKSVRITLSRLRKRGYLNNDRGNWSLTKKGKYIIIKIFYFLIFYLPLIKINN